MANNYQFYYDGDNVTDKVAHMDLDKYSISFKNWDDKEVLLSDKEIIIHSVYGYWH